VDASLWFFQDWSSIVRTVVVGVCGYVALVIALRVAGKRTLAKLNAFDLVVTVAIGSTFASILVSPDTNLAQGIVAFAVLVALQTGIAWASSRFPAVDGWVKSEPRMLLYEGKLIERAMRRERITTQELEVAVRQSGLGRMEDAHAVVLESSGNLTCISAVGGPQATALASVANGAGRPSP
jgi:uncharacterized membrane protein YcaP (DUF421 family)